MNAIKSAASDRKRDVGINFAADTAQMGIEPLYLFSERGYGLVVKTIYRFPSLLRASNSGNI